MSAQKKRKHGHGPGRAGFVPQAYAGVPDPGKGGGSSNAQGHSSEAECGERQSHTKHHSDP